MRLATAASALALFAVAAPGALAQVPAPQLPPPFSPEPNQPPPQPEPKPPPPPPDKPRPARPVDTKLSNERTLSRWAYVPETTYARRAPTRRARGVKRLKTYTEDNTPELVLALRQRRFPDGVVWVEVRLPMRPNNTTGWVRREVLDRYHVVNTFFHVDRRRHRATLYRGGRRVWRAPIGHGKPRTPTPNGNFYVRERLVPTNKRGIYGVFAFGLSAYSEKLGCGRGCSDWPGGGVIGAHGTNQPHLIPGRPSNGCIRIKNPDVERLRKLMPLGTPVRITSH